MKTIAIEVAALVIGSLVWFSALRFLGVADDHLEDDQDAP